MNGRRIRSLCIRVLAVAAWAASANAQTVTSSDVISTSDYINGHNGSFPPSPIAANIYPSQVSVSGLSGTVATVSVTLKNVHSSDTTNDMSIAYTEIMLVSPDGAQLELMGGNIGDTFDNGGLNGANIAIADGNSGMPNNTAFPQTGNLSYKPSAYFSSNQFGVYPSSGSNPPNPLTPAHFPQTRGSSTFASVFTGASPNGSWKLYVMDNSGSPVTINGWSLTLTVNASSVGTTTTVSSNLNPSYTSAPNNSVTFTATVSSTSGAPTGTVAFTDNGSTISGCGAQTLSSGGGNSSTATCATTLTNQGNRPINAIYTATGSFSGSSTTGPYTQLVKAHATNPNGNQYCNTGAISIPGGDGAVTSIIYPSIIDVSGVSNTVASVTVSLSGVSGNVGISNGQFLLVAPGGTHDLDFLSGAGNGQNQPSVNLTIADNNPFPPYGTNGAPLSSGSYQPTDARNTADSFGQAPSLDPQVPGGINYSAPFGASNADTLAQAFNGSTANGSWSLYIINQGGNGEDINVSGGWCLTFTLNSGTPTTTTVVSSTNPALSGTAVTFTATVKDNNGNPVTTGQVTFTDNNSTPAGTVGGNNVVTLNGSGQATFTTSSLAEGDHKFTASYGGTGAFNISSNFIWQRIDNTSTNTSLNTNPVTFCNPGAITIPAGSGGPLNIGQANPNPSNIFVSDLAGTVSSVSVTLNGFHTATAPQLDDIASLLAGPAGKGLDFFSNTGSSNTQVSSPSNFIFSDSAGSLVEGSAGNPASLAAGSYKPTSYGGSDSFFASSSGFNALPGSILYAASAGSSTLNGVYGGSDPNGTWSLYFDQNIHADGGGVGSGWCVTFTENPPDISINDVHAPNHFKQGQTGSFTFTVSNTSGPGSTGGTLSLVESVPTGLTATAMSGTGWNCTTGNTFPTVGPGTVTCTSTAAIAPGDNYPDVTLSVNVAASAPATVTNSATISGSLDNTPADNTAMDTVTVDPAPVLSISKAAVGTFTQGQTAEWDVTVSNTAAAAGSTSGTVTMQDTLPGGYTVASFGTTDLTTWSCSGAGTGTANCTTTVVLAGQASYPVIQIIVNVPAASPVSVTNNAAAFGGGDLTHTDITHAATTSSTVNNVVQVPASITINGSATQSAGIGMAFGSLAVTVKDANSVAIPNYSNVVFTATTGGGGQSGTFSNSTNTITVSANGSGIAEPGVFTANNKLGAYTVGVTAGSASATFNLTNTAGAPATITLLATSNNQSAQINTLFANSLTVTVTDAGGNPASGVTVTFTPPAQTSPSITFAGGQNTAVTNSSGIATSNAITANSHAGGPYNVQVSAGPATNNFSLTNTPGPAANIALTGGSGQSATVTTQFTNPLTATVTDAGNNPVPGVTVTFTPPAASGASVTFAGNLNTAITNGSGVAVSAAITANTHAGGPYNVTATSGSASNNFVLTNTPGTASAMTSVTGTTPQSAMITTAFANNLAVTVTDGFNNPVSGVSVTFTAPTGSGIATGTFSGGLSSVQETTGTNGVATATVFTANTKTGGYTVMATASGVTTVNFSLTNTAGGAANVAINAGNNQSAMVNTAFGTNLQVLVTDNQSNPVPGASVVLTAPSSGASGTFLGGTNTITVNTNASGLATAPTFTANGTVGGPYSVSAASGTGSINFSLTNTPANVQVTVTTNINGPLISVDGGTPFTGSQMFTWMVNTSHSVSTGTPQTNGGTQYVWLNWSDNGAISHNVNGPSTPITITANFKTQYLLTTAVSPSTTEGSISPASGFVDAGTMVPVTATANTGYAFTGFSGALSGTTPTQNVTVNGPTSVTANFAPGPTSLGGSLGVKSGPQNARVWPFTIGNNGPGVALGAQITTLTLQQTSGAACTPVIDTPMPASAGDIGPHATATVNVTIDFTGCATNAFFKVTANLSANSGAATGSIVKLNQLQ